MKLFLVISGVLILLFTSCKHCGKKAGDVTRQDFNLPSINHVKTTGKFFIELHQGAENQLSFQARESLLEGVSYKLENDTLIISNENKCGYLNGYDNTVKLNLTVDSLNTFKIGGASTFEGKLNYLHTFHLHVEENTSQVNLTGRFTNIWLNTQAGGSTVNLTGETTRLYVKDFSYSHINALDMKSISCWVFHAGTGNIKVNVSNSFLSHISGSGNTYYAGNPLHVKDTTINEASGKLIPIN